MATSWDGPTLTYGRRTAGACAVPAMPASLPARRPTVDVLALLPDLLLARLRIALGQEHAVVAVTGLDAFELMLRRRPIDVAVIDPHLAGEDGVDALLDAAVRHPSLVVVAYMSVSPSGMRLAVELASRGVRHVVLKDHDDEPDALRARIESLPADAMTGQMLSALASPLADLPLPIAGAVERLFRAPHTMLGVEDLVRAAGLPRRSFDRALERAGFASARQLVRSARVLRAYVYLRNGRYTPDEVAQRLGYASPQQCWRHVKLVTGFGFNVLRERLEPRAFVEQVTARLRRRPRIEGGGETRPRGREQRDGQRVGGIQHATPAKHY